MKIHFSPAEQKIVDILRDMEWHCLFSELKMKDDRRRLTNIRAKLKEKGYDIVSEPCDGRCGNSHTARLFMRRIVKENDWRETHKNMTDLWNATPELPVTQ